MASKKEENISILLKNFVESQKEILIVFLYNREGLLISKYGQFELENKEEKEIEQVHAALSLLCENLIKKMSLQYQIGRFGTGTFDTPDNRIIFIEAGPDAILICVCSYDTNLDKIFPVTYIVVEKIAQLLEESFDYNFNSLDIPDLTFNEDLELERLTVDKSDPILENVFLKHQIRITPGKRKAFKLIVLGSAAVGKTTLINSFLQKHQITDYRPTLGISISTKKYNLQGFKDDTISFLIFDLAGQEFFKRVRHDYYTGASCAFIVYDITRKDTFEDAINFWYKDAKNELTSDIPIVFIGNKIDLEDERQVLKEEGVSKANELKASFIETAALHNINVLDTFKIIGIGLLFKTIEDVLE